MTARDVPGFPENDPKLMDLKNWPKKRRIGSWDCELQIKRRHDTSAYYLCHRGWWPWGKAEIRGPEYTWASHGKLIERVYWRPREAVLHQLDREGRLLEFVDRKRGTAEYFDIDGVLIGGEYEPINLDWRSEGYRGGTVNVWLGERLTHGEFVRRVADLNRERG